MKAGFLVGERTYEVREMPEPSAPADGLVIKVGACGVCGSDIRRWKEGPPKGTDAILAGHEVAGEVVDVGRSVTQFKIGDKLAVAPDIHCGWCWYCQRGKYNLCDNLRLVGITPGYPGGFAEKMVITREILVNGIVHRMPNDMSFREGALAEPLSSVTASQRQAGISIDDVVVIMGAGPIGCLHIALAKARGARVIVSQPSETRRKLAERFEPDVIINPHEQDLVAAIRDFTNGLGASVTICCNPVAATQTQAVLLTRKGGRILLFGGLPKANPMTTLDGNIIHYGEKIVQGSFSYHPTMHEAAVDLVYRKVIKADQFITDAFPLEDIGKAFESAGSGRGLKVIVEPSFR